MKEPFTKTKSGISPAASGKQPLVRPADLTPIRPKPRAQISQGPRLVMQRREACEVLAIVGEAAPWKIGARNRLGWAAPNPVNLHRGQRFQASKHVQRRGLLEGCGGLLAFPRDHDTEHTSGSVL